MVKMKAGTYYVGDLCYVMGDKWAAFCERSQGIQNIEEIKYCWFYTEYGDGRYEDNFGKEYPVDAGLIGCILVSDIVESPENNLKLGNIYDFPEDFECSKYYGKIVFGHVEIETGDIEDDEEIDEWPLPY